MSKKLLISPIEGIKANGAKAVGLPKVKSKKASAVKRRINTRKLLAKKSTPYQEKV
tara:strand:- start:456 stop:623 length:168 start_codon:yes stop_codon:yes gene_type:complete